MKFGSDDELVEAFKAGGERRHHAMSHIYYNSDIRKRISYFIKYKNGNLDEVDDVFTESFIIFERNIRHNKFKNESNINTYFYSIARNYYLGKLRSKPKYAIDSEKEFLKMREYQNPELIFLKEENKSELQKILKMLSEKCRKVLEFWSKSYSYSEITKELDFGTRSSARKQKFMCIRKLAEKVKEHPEFIRSK